jgi:hypothetical protein
MNYKFKNIVFEGGGVKGIAYGGALLRLEEIVTLSEIERVAGTSAGAITACLLAVGYDANSISKIIASTDFSKFEDDTFLFIRDIYRLIKHYGWNRGDTFEKWLGDLIEQMKPTQQQIDDLTSRGIVPGARINCAIDGAVGTVLPFGDWYYTTLGIRVGGEDSENDSVFGYSKRRQTYATVLESTPPQTLSITIDRVKEAMKTSPEAKAALESLFPEVKDPEPVEFGPGNFNDKTGRVVLTAAYISAPPGMERKCLGVDPEYRMEVSEYEGRQILS